MNNHTSSSTLFLLLCSVTLDERSTTLVSGNTVVNLSHAAEYLENGGNNLLCFILWALLQIGNILPLEIHGLARVD